MSSLKFLLFLCVIIGTKANFDMKNVSEHGETGLISSDKCSSKALNSFLEALTPEDYEEAKLSDIHKRVRHMNETIVRFERLQTFQQNVSKKFEPIFNRLSQRFSEILMEINLPNDCMTDLIRIATAVQNRKPWAMKYIEALVVPESGLMQNNKPSVGYDQCLDFAIPSYELKSGQKIKGQYCWFGIPNIMPAKYDPELFNDTVVEMINDNMKNSPVYNTTSGLRLDRPRFERSAFFETILMNNYRKTFMTKLPMGICIPSTCKAQDIEYVLNKVLYPIIRFPIDLNPDCDYADKPIEINTLQWISILTFTMLAILVIISTIYEIIGRLTMGSKKPKRRSLLQSFPKMFDSISNFKKLFADQKSGQKFKLLDGVRTILSFWVLIVHEHFLDFLPLNAKRSKSSVSNGLFNSHKYMAHKNFNFMETFFFIGGMMLSYVMISKLERSKGKFVYIQYAIVRYLRVMPITIGCILLIFIYPLFGSGPLWTMTTSILYIPCRDNWLGSLLMTNNIDINIPTKYICNTAGWYISADYHLYLLAPILFLIYHFRPGLATISSLALLLVGIVICLLPSLVWNIPHMYESSGSNPDSIYTQAYTFQVYYWRTDPHIVSYVFGMFCGYLIRQKPNLYLGGRVGELFIWVSTTAVMIATMYWNDNLLDFYRPLERSEMQAFIAISKVTYLGFWFWLFYACATGRGGFVNRFFSWGGFKSTANLSFEICLLHVMVILYRVGTSRYSAVYSAYYCWTITVFDYLVTYLVSLIFHLLVSAPFANIVNSFIK